MQERSAAVEEVAQNQATLPPQHISSVIAKVVGPCNLNCSYCYV